MFDSAQTNGNATPAKKSMRQRITVLVEAKPFTRAIFVVIILNTVILGLETVPAISSRVGGLLNALNIIFIGVYVVEAALKLFAYRGGYFRSGWNVFDFIIVITCLVPTGGVFSGLRVVRVFRVLRAFRLISGLKPLRKIVSAIVRSLPGVGWTFLLMMLVYYVFAIVGIHLFSDVYPQRFSSLPGAFGALFQLTTLDSWLTVVQPVVAVLPGAWVYFVLFMVISSFILINVVLGIVVDSMKIARDDEEAEARQAMLEKGVGPDEAIQLAMNELHDAMSKLDDLLRARQASVNPQISARL